MKTLGSFLCFVSLLWTFPKMPKGFRVSTQLLGATFSLFLLQALLCLKPSWYPISPTGWPPESFVSLAPASISVLHFQDDYLCGACPLLRWRLDTCLTNQERIRSGVLLGSRTVIFGLLRNSAFQRVHHILLYCRAHPWHQGEGCWVFLWGWFAMSTPYWGPLIPLSTPNIILMTGKGGNFYWIVVTHWIGQFVYIISNFHNIPWKGWDNEGRRAYKRWSQDWMGRCQFGLFPRHWAPTLSANFKEHRSTPTDALLAHFSFYALLGTFLFKQIFLMTFQSLVIAQHPNHKD